MMLTVLSIFLSLIFSSWAENPCNKNITTQRQIDDEFQLRLTEMQHPIKFLDAKNVGRYDTIRAIAVGLAKEAGLSANIEIKVFDDKKYSDCSPFTGPCSPLRPWLAMPKSWMESAPLSHVCFALSHEIGHISRQDRTQSAYVSRLPLHILAMLVGVLRTPVAARGLKALQIHGHGVWVIQSIALLTGATFETIAAVALRNDERGEEIAADAHATRQCGSECGVHFFVPEAHCKHR